MPKQRYVARAAGAAFGVEALAFYVLAAVHLGAPLGVDVQPQESVAAVAVLCGFALDVAAVLCMKHADSAWRAGIAALVLCAVSVLLIDMVLATPADGSALYRGFLAMVAVSGLLMMTRPVKAALGHPEPERRGRR